MIVEVKKHTQDASQNMSVPTLIPIDRTMETIQPPTTSAQAI
jgi:hypothetical protein